MNNCETVEAWEFRRARLSHDDLKNELSPALSKLCRVLGQHVSDHKFVVSFRDYCLPRIKRLGEDLSNMMTCAPSALSPRQFFNREPLSLCDADTMEWLPVVIHDLWITRADVMGRLAATTKQIGRLNAACAKLETAFLSGDSSAQYSAAVELRATLAELSHAVSDARGLLPY